MDIHRLSRPRFLQTTFWAVLVSCLIVIVASFLARATLNLNAALTDKPDIALYLLLPDEEITTSSLVRERTEERQYIAETKDGPKLIILKKGEKEWYVSEMEQLHQ
ncbi:MAG: hypothetical protein V1926_00365 [Candidatus Peregrinibacteria bacterium]